MKLATFVAPEGRPTVGVVQDDRIGEVRAFPSMLSLIEAGLPALKSLSLGKSHALKDVQLLAPIPRPPRIRDFLCFELHVRQSRANRYLFGMGTERLDPAKVEIAKVWYERPVYYKGNPFSVVGHEAEVHWPSYSRIIDYELEIGLVIGRGGKNLSRGQALEHVFGYTIFNDFSARDEQTKEMAGSLGPGKGKDFDNGNAMGPCLVTADEIGDPYSLAMAVRVNGEEWGRGNSRDMHWKFEDCIAHASRSETLHPGEFFGSGTVGNGCGLEQMRFLKPGDVVELEVERIGILRNRVVR